jgi:hypothetical protein
LPAPEIRGHSGWRLSCRFARSETPLGCGPACKSSLRCNQIADCRLWFPGAGIPATSLKRWRRDRVEDFFLDVVRCHAFQKRCGCKAASRQFGHGRPKRARLQRPHAELPWRGAGPASENEGKAGNQRNTPRSFPVTAHGNFSHWIRQNESPNSLNRTPREGA